MSLVAIDTDKRKSNALDIDIVDFRVNENVVDVQLHGRDFLGIKPI